ncbi:hypothetical protein [Legionella saoudiensis]|uniref:hypothetical protein n=1 Tax=Legionella saoudiensis TaxID=1750561 RepID=UPI0007304C0B|nr:hypothetical protein [Legionella saoudiensis]
MTAPFFIILKKKHVVPLKHSFISEEAQELQLLVATGQRQEYRKKVDEYAEIGKTFRLTKGHVYETTYEDIEKGLFKQTTEISVALQVKGHSLTWYFWADAEYMDQYPQSFRDQLYNAAALAHQKVANGCDMYYRGSNAVHIKLMHHLESESNRNHNHYRLRDNKPYTPEDFNQHLRALQESSVHSIFFEDGEIDQLCEKFAKYHAEWTKKETEESMSQEELYFRDSSQQLDVIDLLELGLFGGMQEPCRLQPDELKVDFDKAREEIQSIVSEDVEDEQGRSARIAKLLKEVEAQYEEILKHRKDYGSRGLHSGIASSRQVKGSTNEVVKANMGMDDAEGRKEHVQIPKWAVKALDDYHKGMDGLITQALKRLPDEKDKVIVLKALSVLTQIEKQPESVDEAIEQIKSVSGIDLLAVSTNVNASEVKTSFFNPSLEQGGNDVTTVPQSNTGKTYNV